MNNLWFKCRPINRKQYESAHTLVHMLYKLNIIDYPLTVEAFNELSHWMAHARRPELD